MVMQCLSEHMYLQVLQASDDNVCVLNHLGDIVFVNNAWIEFARVNGSTCSDWLSVNYLASFDNAVAAGDRLATQMKRGIGKVLAGETREYSVEYPCHSPYELRFFILKATRIKLDGNIFVAIFHKRLLAHKEFGEQKARFDIAINAGKIGIWEFDLTSNALQWNDWMYNIYAIDPEHGPIRYADWIAKVHPDDKHQTKKAILEAVSSQRTFECEFRIIPRLGEVAYIEARAHVLTNNFGKPVKMIGVNLDVTEKRLAAEQIKTLAYIDQVTQLPNRRAFSEYLKAAIALAGRTHQFSALLFLDVDNFKRINDSLGHSAGDLYLHYVAEKLKRQLRRSDFVARLGGDEFVVVLSDLADNEFDAYFKATRISEKMLSVLEEPVVVMDKECTCSTSIGITLFQGGKDQCDDIVRQADLAMYKAKQTSKGSVGLFDKSLQTKIEREIELERNIRIALKENQFSLHYQAQIDQFQTIVGCEILLRWNHPELGDISPTEFISLAEESHLINEIGHWVFRNAFAQIAIWQQQKWAHGLKFAINVSVRQFGEPSFTRELLKLMNEYSIKPDSICLELTESILIADVDVTVRKIKELAKQGIQFSIDDFGTGYSSLSYLNRLPIQQLKIDRSFVFDFSENEAAKSIVKAIIAMSDSLGFNTIAEGVETNEQLVTLCKLGCDYFQGYFFSRPISAIEFEQLVRSAKVNVV